MGLILAQNERWGCTSKTHVSRTGNYLKLSSGERVSNILEFVWQSRIRRLKNLINTGYKKKL